MDDDASILPATAPPSQVQQATQAFIGAVDSGARKEGSALLNSYYAVEQRLQSALDDVDAEFRRLQSPPTPDMYFRQARLRELLRLTNVLVGEYANFVVGRMDAGQNAAIRAAYNAAGGITALAAGQPAIATGWAGINPTTILNLHAQLADQAPAREVLQQFAPDAVNAMRRSIIEGATMGLGPREIVRQMRQIASYPKVRAERLVRTEILRAANEGLRQGFTDLGVKFWRWSASLSARTCPACLSMNGKVFPITTPMPRHVQCRCSMSPVIGKPKPGELPQGWEDGEKWLRRQPTAVQDQILGKTASLAWQHGVFKLDRLVQVSHDPVWGSTLSRKSNRQLYQGLDQAQKDYWDQVVVPSVKQGAADQRRDTIAAKQAADQRRAMAALQARKIKVPEPQAPGPAVPWRASMTREEAMAWQTGNGADPLVLGRDFYHGTNKAAARDITTNGFNTGIVTNGRVFGNGVYLGGSWGIAKSYSRGSILTAWINPKRVGNYDELYQDSDFQKERVKLQWSYAGVNDEYQKRYDAAKTPAEKKEVYDAWKKDGRVVDPEGESWRAAMEARGYDAWYSPTVDYWIIPNAENVTIVERDDHD